MSALDVARAALSVFPANVAQTMVAISGAESGFDNTAKGDPLTAVPRILCGVQSANYACGGYTSFGAWQVNLPCNHELVASLSGAPASDPCGQAAWITQSYENAARVALAIFRSQGYGAWTTYRSGAYGAYMAQAQAALEEAKQSGVPAAPGRSPSGVWILVLGAASLVGAGVAVALVVDAPLRDEVSTSIRRLWAASV